MPAKVTITNSLRELRAKHGMTQEDLALAVGVTRQTIIAIEANKYSPSLGLAFALAEALKVSITKAFQVSA